MNFVFRFFLCFQVLVGGCVVLHSQPTILNTTLKQLSSPDKNVVFTFYQKMSKDSTKQMYYTVYYKNKLVINESVLDIQLDNHLSEQAMALKVDKHKVWCENLNLIKVHEYTVDTFWKPVYGEQEIVKENYNALVVELVKADNPIYKINVEIKAFNEGVAFRYFFPENEKGTYYRVIAENTEFALPENAKAWTANWAQAPYKLQPISDWEQESERPLTIELQNGLIISLAEAQLVDYSRTKFKLSLSKPNTIVTSMHDAADLISPIGTPWRAILIAEKYADLPTKNHVLLSLNEPSKIKDNSWLIPGKIMRVMSQTTTDAFSNIDFAVRHNLQYILFDWKWYGPAFSFNSDATKVAISNFDLPAIIKYGKEKGVGVWLYVNQQALLAQSDSLFKVYKDWGVKGVKFGFVQVGSHRWTTWVEKAIQQAAQSNIMVNIHDDWRPTGEQRTYPNLMTAEGIRGNEEMPDATHNTILPFTRYLAGAADYTVCYYSNRIKTTHAHQLALAAIYYSPIQTLYWYDKPEMSNNEPELSFWDNIPTTWDETKILDGKPGEFVITTRRNGNNWFLGAITNTKERIVNIDFSFLKPNQKYKAVIYEDNDSVATKTKVGVVTKQVDGKTKLSFNLKASGGVAIMITPINK